MKRGRNLGGAVSLFVTALVLVVFGFGGVHVADAVCASNVTSCSTSYGLTETYFGTGGQLGVAGDGCSTSYCAKSAVGELGVGSSSSTSYKAQSGFNTDRTPSITFAVSGGTDLGVLSVGSTATATATFAVKTYLSNGYVVKTQANPPKTSWPIPHTFNALSTPTAASNGVEQFGMNLVANTSPTSFGAAPAQFPDSTFSFGSAAAGYNTPNLFKYVNGDTIASSTRSSGETDYTISYIYDISNVTVAGTYSFNDVLVATSTF